MMQSSKSIRRVQGGAYLLEALIGILIFSFGILGIVGLQAQAIRFTNDAEYRAEAVYLANSLVSQMWTEKQSLLQVKYTSPGGPEYVNFRDNQVLATFGAAVMTKDPDVLVDTVPSLSAPSKTSSVVQVTIYWTLPGDTVQHNYTTVGVIGQN